MEYSVWIHDMWSTLYGSFWVPDGELLDETCFDDWCARIFALIFMKILLVVNYYIMSLSLKFHKDMNFRKGDIELFVTLYNLEVKY